LIGGNIDLDLLSLFPKRYARIMGGMERGASFPRSTMDGEKEREEKWANQGIRRGWVFIPPPVKIAITAFMPDNLAPRAKIRPKTRPYRDMHAQKFEGADYPAKIWADYPA
jgi:hypothetical protein